MSSLMLYSEPATRDVPVARPRARRGVASSTAWALVSLLTPVLAAAQGGPRSIAASGDIASGGKLVSTTTSGPPLEVSSSEQVVGLNADLLDGLHAGSFALDTELALLTDLVATQQDTIDAQQQLIARLHPKLLLHDGRFRAWVTFTDDGIPQPAEAVPLGISEEEGFFYFTRDFYVDVYLKVLDGRLINDSWWVFAAPLTGLELTLTLLDTETGGVVSYPIPAGARTSILDTGAFPDLGGFPVKTPRGPEPAAQRLVSATGASCISDSETLCLVNDRFQVRATFEYPPDSPLSDAQVSAVIDTSHSGALWLFDSLAVDILVKVVQKPTFFEVNIGTLTNAEFTVTVTDTCTGTTEDYVNPAGSTTNFGDAATFANTPCP
jgi:hypothetical protein